MAVVRLRLVGLSQGLVVLLAGCLGVGALCLVAEALCLGAVGLSVAWLVAQASCQGWEEVMVLVRLAVSLVEQAVYLVALSQVWVAEEPLQVALASLALVGLLKLWSSKK